MTKKVEYKYKFSFVMPIYNTGSYLEETILSIVNQSIGFRDNVEIIFINDGSSDNSEEICLKYKQLYRENITYIKQKNKGVSAARNFGLKKVTGKYVSFLDSDDLLSRDTLKTVYDYFEDHEDEIDFIAIKLMLFGARRHAHQLNYKFEFDRIFDISKDFEYPQLTSASTFQKSAIAKKYKFDTKLTHAEDAKYLSEILLAEKGKYAALAKPIYYYRKRLEGNSALDLSFMSRTWYEVPSLCHSYLFGLSRKTHGKVIRYIQYLVMYDLQWRFKQAEQSVLSDVEELEYKKAIDRLLKDIDDEVIVKQRNISPELVVYILARKNKIDLLKEAEYKDKGRYLNDLKVYDYRINLPSVRVYCLRVVGGVITLEGYVNGIVFNNSKLYLKAADKNYPIKYKSFRPKLTKFLGEIIYTNKSFRVDIPLSDGMIIESNMLVGDDVMRLSLIMHRHSHIANDYRSYKNAENYLVSKNRNTLRVQSYNKLRHVFRELTFIILLCKRFRLAKTKERLGGLKRSGYGDLERMRLTGIGIGEAVKNILKASSLPFMNVGRNVVDITWRLAYYSIKPLVRRKIWLISDRVMAAGDSAEALFRYVNEKDDLQVKVYYAISKKCDDYKRMKLYGRVVNHGSLMYKMLFLLSDKIISTHADDFVINAFASRVDDFIDLYNFDFVFLQHGIIKDDISGWLNRFNKDIKMFVTSAKPEYESVLSCDYGYDSNVVKLTGLPRYDLLQNKPKNKIILAPTWRKNLVTSMDKTHRYRYSEEFKKSDYFKFYNSLMNDRRIIDCLKSSGMTGELYLHPAFCAQIRDFGDNEVFKAIDMPYDYKTAFAEGNLLITDFSSVVFDFAYLKKPVIYTQFDRDTFYGGHLYEEGYFSYEKNGFGPVVYDYEEAVDVILKQIQAGCRMDELYIKRVESFFLHSDRNNCKRTYESIVDME